MGVNLKYGSIAVGAYYAHQHGSLQPSFSDQYYPKWDRGGARGPNTWKDKNRWVSLWPRGSFGGGNDGSNPYTPIGSDLGAVAQYEPYSCDGPGCQTVRFIKGICYDSDSVIVANAIVQGFRTVDDVYVGQDVSRLDGSYVLGTDNSTSVQHYLVAYKPGSPDIAGTTVNTLLPTEIDA